MEIIRKAQEFKNQTVSVSREPVTDETNDVSRDAAAVTSENLQRLIEEEEVIFNEQQDYAPSMGLEGGDFNFDTCSDVDLYFEILFSTDYEGTVKNFALNQKFLNHIKDEYKNRPCVKKAHTRDLLFQKLFSSVSFYKKELRFKHAPK